MVMRVVVVDALRLRASPGTEGTRIVGLLRRGQRLKVLADANLVVEGYEWIEVKTVEGQPGWVAKRFTVEDSPDRFQARFWPTEHRVITQWYGENPDYYRQFGLNGHEGLDIRAPGGSKIFAIDGGTVKLVLCDPRPKRDGGYNYGIHPRLSHADGFESIYAHMQACTVRQGDVVAAGQVLGLADNTGNSFGDHLHLTLKQDGQIIDPWPYLKEAEMVREEG